MSGDRPADAGQSGIIDRLVADLRPQRARSPRRDAAVVAFAGLAELAILWACGLARADLGHALGTMAFWWRIAGLGVIAAIGCATCAVSLDPARCPRRGLRLLPAALVAVAVSGWLIDAVHGVPVPIAARLAWPSGLVCASKIVLLSVAPMLALAVLMREGAPSDPAETALASGAAAAALGAMVFAVACPSDDPLYIVVWYAAGCGLVTLLARLVLPIFTRW